MKRPEAYERLSEYLSGELNAAEKTDFEQCLVGDLRLQEALELSQRLELAFQSQQWLTPSADFTAQILARIEPAETPVRIWDRFKSWEWMRTGLSAAAVLLAVVFYGSTLWSGLGEILQTTANWLDSLTGFPVFALHPAVVLGLVAPFLAGGFATCVLAGRCRLNP